LRCASGSSRRLDCNEIAVEVNLQQRRGMIGWATRHLRHNPQNPAPPSPAQRQTRRSPAPGYLRPRNRPDTQDRIPCRRSSPSTKRFTPSSAIGWGRLTQLRFPHTLGHLRPSAAWSATGCSTSGAAIRPSCGKRVKPAQTGPSPRVRTRPLVTKIDLPRSPPSTIA
jgi:hypothetical protein